VQLSRRAAQNPARRKAVLKTVDGMAPVDAVATAIDHLLDGTVRTVRWG